MDLENRCSTRYVYRSRNFKYLFKTLNVFVYKKNVFNLINNSVKGADKYYFLFVLFPTYFFDKKKCNNFIK